MNMFILSNLSNMIIDSASVWVAGRWVGKCSVGEWSVNLIKLRKKRVVISLVCFG